MDRRGIKYKIFLKGDEIHANDEIPIYHVHGFLPQKVIFNGDIEKSIVFAEQEYHNQYENSYCWQNIIQVNLLREKTALFIGSSLQDPNIRRLLDIANRYSKNPKHYAILPDKRDNSSISNILRSMEESTFKELGVNVIWIRDFSETIDIINKIDGRFTNTDFH